MQTPVLRFGGWNLWKGQRPGRLLSTIGHPLASQPANVGNETPSALDACSMLTHGSGPTPSLANLASRAHSSGLLFQSIVRNYHAKIRHFGA